MPLAGIETPSDTVRLLSCPRGVMSEPNHKTASNQAGAYSPEGANDASQVPFADMATIEAWLKEHKISEVECLVPDMTGNARGNLYRRINSLRIGKSSYPNPSWCKL